MPQLCFVYLLAWKQDLAYFARESDRRQIRGYNGWQMHRPLRWATQQARCLFVQADFSD